MAFDAVVIGGGFFGCVLAAHLKQEVGLDRVLVVEREGDILTRASYANQARVHNGYHYPRSFTTAYRSRVNMPRFQRDFPDCVADQFTKVYAVARQNSMVTARQFERFCKDIGAPCGPAPQAVRRLFTERLIEAVFLVEEFAFDAVRLRAKIRDLLEQQHIQLELNATVTDVFAGSQGGPLVIYQSPEGEPVTIAARWLFNCTYAGLNHLGAGFGPLTARIKYEITELALLRVPESLAALGITVMDGPFFSVMPFPPRDLHTLSHVRYTPHLSWTSESERQASPYDVLASYHKKTRVGPMLRDSARYLPSLAKAEYVDSLWEVKTVLVSSEGDDSRPILFEAHEALPRSYSVLGGKVDNIYDVLDVFSTLDFGNEQV